MGKNLLDSVRLSNLLLIGVCVLLLLPVLKNQVENFADCNAAHTECRKLCKPGCRECRECKSQCRVNHCPIAG